MLGAFSQGRVFQGRYKSVPVNSSDADRYYFRIVADYIHLNPARAGLAGGRSGTLAGYRWSSLLAYAGGKVPPWLEIDRVLISFELAKDGRGLQMGHPGSVSRQVGIVKRDKKLLKKLNELEKMCHCVD